MDKENYLYNPARLEALRKSGFLDSQETFVDLAFKGCQLLEAEICQINALGGKKQKTVACFPFKKYAELPVEDTGCQVPVKTRKSFLVKNSRTHPSTCTEEWSKEFAGYLGSPIFYSGEAVGTICVLTADPRNWTNKEQKILESISAEIGQRLIETSKSP